VYLNAGIMIRKSNLNSITRKIDFGRVSQEVSHQKRAICLYKMVKTRLIALKKLKI